MTELVVRGFVVYSQSWSVNRVTSPRNRGRQRIWSRFNAETIRQARGQARPENYPFTGWYAALLSSPRIRFQYAVYDRNNNFVRWSMQVVRFPVGAPASDWSRVVLVRGTNTNYFRHLNEGNLVVLGSWSSFSDVFQTARNYAAPQSGQEDDGEPTIIMIQERVHQANSPPPAYARPILGISVYPRQREYVIDPVTRFRVVSIEINEKLGITRKGGRRPPIPLTIIRLEYFDNGRV